MPEINQELNQPGLRLLREWIVSETAEPPVVLTGTSNEMLAAKAMELAQTGLCEQGARCGTCQACRLVKQRTHPDFVVLATDRATITIKQVRELLTQLNQMATAGRRLVWIERADRLSMPATHALLKSLEEPAATTRWLLTTRLPRRLPLTILSRAQQVWLRVAQVPAVELEAVWPNGRFERLSDRKGSEHLDDEQLHQIGDGLSAWLRRVGSSPELRRAFMRLRDYHFVAATGGNTKLAGEVLLASLPEKAA